MRYIAVLLLCAGVACAQEVSLGMFNAKGYNGLYAATSVGKTSLYWEHEDKLGYDLVVATHPLSDKLTLVVRAEDQNWLRAGLKFGLGSGSSQFTVVAVCGIGEAPDMVDVFTPPLELCKGATLDGWLRSREGGKPAIWVGPTIIACRTKLWFRSDLNGGTWIGGIDLPAIHF